MALAPRGLKPQDMLFFQQSPANFNRKTERNIFIAPGHRIPTPSRIKPDSPYLPGQTRGDKPSRPKQLRCCSYLPQELKLKNSAVLNSVIHSAPENSLSPPVYEGSDGVNRGSGACAEGVKSAGKLFFLPSPPNFNR